jgi:hypothetical protein
VATFKTPVPTHLCIFVTDPESGRPVTRLPLYAEAAVPRIVPMPPLNERFREPVRAALIEADSTATGAVRDRVEKAALEALVQILAEASRNQLLTQPERVRELFNRVFRATLAASGRALMADIPQADLKPLINAALRRMAAEMGLDLVPEAEDVGAIWADPLGVLTTDHVGYASFDLKRLRPEVQVMLAEAIEARRNDPQAVLKLAIWVYPYGHAGRFDALSQARFGFDAVVARLAMKWNTLPPALINMGPRALQNPSLTDWRLSAASFAASPKTLVGENGCEELVPANLALQEFVLRQVVRLTNVPQGFGVPPGFKAAYVDDYKVSWFSLGHSLGEILYSLPLAPGETVKLAVIDWSWDSLTKRDETTKLTEEILHQTHRDRTITETVKAGLKELQHGSSFMGGAAGASGGSGGANLGVVGLGAAVGNTWSLGGSTATSDGSRDLAAENVQRLNDSFSQASSAQRELNSTVVIQARQEEKESIQTRTFSNYNHSHTLTILYYEVLRHYRVTVEWVRRRPAVLVKLPIKLPGVLTAQVLLSRRYLLEPYLLDKKLGAAFDAAARFLLGVEKLNRETDKWGATLQTTDPGAKSFVKLIAQFTTTSVDTNEPVFVVLQLHDGRAFEFQCDGAGAEGTSPEFEKPLPVPISWNQIKGFEIKLKNINAGGDWQETNVLITMVTAANERVNVLADWTIRTLSGSDSNATTGLMLAVQPPPATTTSGVGPKPKRVDFISAEDDLALQTLITHVDSNRTYYNSVLLLATDPNTIAIEFEGMTWSPGQMISDHVDPTPLDVFGSYVAFPLAKQLAVVDDTIVVDIAAALNGNDPARRQWAAERLAAMSDAERQSVLERLPLASAKSERLTSMATRGVFAEGKLGHCNVSEEIDNTRFWKWEEHPIPIEAPGINPVTPVQPQPQQVSATPTAFPQSLVNIVNPTAAPDPTGLAAALSLLGTPNIFRDMSGRQEVADLLKKLSDNTIAIADAATRAREIQGKYGSNLQGLGQGGGGASTGGPGGVSSQPGGPTASNDPTKGVQQLAGANNDLVGYADADVIKKNANKISDSTGQLAARLAFGLDADVADAGGGADASSVSPFSTVSYAAEMSPSGTQNTRLATAMQTVRATLSNDNKTRLDNVSIIVVKLTPSGTMDYAGVRETSMYFSGSLLKVSLLYTSFELVARVNALAPGITANSVSDFFAKVAQEFDAKIASAVPSITAGPWRKVQFDKALTATPGAAGKYSVKMSQRHDQDLRSIFSNQLQNDGARECMHRLGFSYVNGALAAAGFLGLAAPNGIWMATDYIKDVPPDPGNWRSFEVPVVTGTSSAAMTTLMMANLLNQIHRRKLIDAATSQTMRDIYATAGAWLSTLANPNAFSFTAEGAKVGHSDSASANVGMVMSEALFIKRKSDSSPFVAVWQNVPDPLGAQPIYQVIDELVKNWP